MSRRPPIQERFADANDSGRAALIPYITAGVPDLDQTTNLLIAAARAGADIIEIGFPFSDPLADGPTLQRAHHVALRRAAAEHNAITVQRVFDMVRHARERLGDSRPEIVLMSYYNPIYRYGDRAFVRDALESGISGAIIPDLPLDEAGNLLEASDGTDFAPIFLLAPTSTDARIKHVASVARGFVYVVSVTGVTGERRSLPMKLKSFVERIRQDVEVPLAVGFGVSTPQQAADVAEIADGVVVGSALMQRVMDAKDGEQSDAVSSFVSELRQAVVRRQADQSDA